MTFSRIREILLLLVVGYSQCAQNDCSTDRIAMQMMASCMNKRASVYGEQMLIRKHRIDENYPHESEELVEKEILGIGQDIPTERKEIPNPGIVPQFYHQNQQQYYQQQPIYYYPRLPNHYPHGRLNIPQTNDQQQHVVINNQFQYQQQPVVMNHQFQHQQQQQYIQRPSIIFPGLTYVPPPPSRPYTEAQHQYETYYSSLNTQQKRMLRNEYAHVRNLVMTCCRSKCDENELFNLAC